MWSPNMLYAVCAFVFVIADDEVALPKSVKICKQDVDDYSSCLGLAIQQAWPIFLKGIPELDLPRLDPLDSAVYEANYQNGDIQVKLSVKNTRFYGLSSTNFLAARPYRQKDRFRLEIDAFIPKVFMEGELKAEGIVYQLKIAGKGRFNVTLEGMNTTFNLDGHIENDRWVVERFGMSPEVTRMKIGLVNLVSGNEDLSKVAVSIVNEYWPIFYQAVLPIVTSMADAPLAELANRVFSKVSFSKTFP